MRAGWMVAAAIALAPAAVRAEAQAGATGETVDQAVCRLIEAAAAAQSLPVGFLTRLIWRESSFRTHVVSPAGAQGIAQFMPGTARERGLSDPFDPETAIPAAAALLGDLRRRFGNLGLAAAAYNGGPERVRQWLAGASGLPAETTAYVARITGRSADDWAEDARRRAAEPEATPERCLTVLALFRTPGADPYFRVAPGEAPFAPWGVQVAGNFSKARALAGFQRVRREHAGIVGDLRPMIVGTRVAGRGRRPFYRVRLPAETRGAAEKLCERLRAARGACIVLRS